MQPEKRFLPNLSSVLVCVLFSFRPLRRAPSCKSGTESPSFAQAVNESSYMSIPTIAFTDTDSPLVHIDCAIPSNNKGKLSIALLYHMLARDVLRLRGSIPVAQPWDVVMDLFLYRDVEELEDMEAAQAAGGAAAETWGGGAEAPAAPTPAAATGDWGAAAPADAGGGDWGAAPPAAAATGGDWGAAPPAADGGWGGEAPAAAATEW